MSFLGEARPGIRIRALLFCLSGVTALLGVSFGFLERPGMIFYLLGLYAFGEVVLALPRFLEHLDAAAAHKR